MSSRRSFQLLSRCLGSCVINQPPSSAQPSSKSCLGPVTFCSASQSRLPAPPNFRHVTSQMNSWCWRKNGGARREGDGECCVSAGNSAEHVAEMRHRILSSMTQPCMWFTDGFTLTLHSVVKIPTYEFKRGKGGFSKPNIQHPNDMMRIVIADLGQAPLSGYCSQRTIAIHRRRWVLSLDE